MRLPQSFLEGLNGPGTMPIEQQAQEAIFDVTGAVVEPVFDGRIHRFRVDGDKGGERSGWYVLFGDRLPAGAFGNWKDADEGTRWCANGTNTDENREELEAVWRRIRETREAEQKRSWAEAAETCRQIWTTAPEAPANHPYLQKKKVKNHGLRVTGDGRLIVPVYVGTELASLQYIDADGGKLYHAGGRTGGGYFRIPANNPAARTRFIAEGYATAASIHEATGCEVWAALSAGNLKKVGRFLRDNLPEADLCFVGDNDASGTGQRAATEAAEAVNGRAIIIPEPGDANDYAASGKDLRALLVENHVLKLVPWLEFCGKPQPIRWLIKGWLREEAQMMIFGASGAGKTFVVLDMALSIACPQIQDWHGHRLKHGPVVYLAGEGYAGLKQRLAGWKAHRGVTSGDLLVSENTVDLDTGDVEAAINDIEAFGKPPCLIVVDTLIHFMAGDENKAQDTRLMLQGCAKLYRHFGCSVLLIHHTGVAQDAQSRARGSSAWRGAMDIELKVVKEDPESAILALGQTKNKDAACARTLMFEQVTVEVPGWLDEDGEQVTTTVIELCEKEQDDGEERQDRDDANLSDNERLAADTLFAAALEHGRLNEAGEFEGVHIDDWRNAFYSKSTADTEAGKRSMFNRIRKKLQTKGLLHVLNDVYRFAGKLEGRNPLPLLLQNGGE